MQLIFEHFAELAPPLLEGLGVTLQVMAGAVVLAHSTSVDWRAAVLTVVATGLFLSDRLHPLLVLAAAAVVGAFGLVG